jgi:Tol biopolymer transport system component
MRLGFIFILCVLLASCEREPGIQPATSGLERPHVIGKYQAGAVHLFWPTNSSFQLDENRNRIIDTEQFVIEMSKESPLSLTDLQTVPASTRDLNIEELTNNQPYYFAIRAEGKGRSVRSNVIMVIPQTLPDQQSPPDFEGFTPLERSLMDAPYFSAFLWNISNSPTANAPIAAHGTVDSLQDWGAVSFSWTAAQDKLVFAQGIGLSSGEKWGHIGVYDLNQDTVITLTKPELFYDHQPAWSPDGEWICYLSDEQAGEEYHIWKVKSDGSERFPIHQDLGGLNELVHKPWRSPGYPVFSSQGDKIIFHRQKALGAGYVYSLYEMPADGGEVSVLHDSPWNDQQPYFSPTENKVAFFSDRSGQQEIWILDLSTQEMIQVSGGKNMPLPKVERGLSWSPDGKEIVYMKSLDNKPHLVNVD